MITFDAESEALLLKGGPGGGGPPRGAAHVDSGVLQLHVRDLQHAVLLAQRAVQRHRQPLASPLVVDRHAACVYTIQYNATLLSLCRNICFLARHLHQNIQYS